MQNSNTDICVSAWINFTHTVMCTVGAYHVNYLGECNL